ncbi:MAG: BamA/TamA family outer membrane protein [Microscillaceae bacterium]|nr:BamA/TamA family outer membrane protein [Microscillaceae bacterium]
MMKKGYLLLCLLFGCMCGGQSQDFAQEKGATSVVGEDTLQEKKRGFLVLPIIVYAPETSLRLGVIGAKLFKLGGEGTQLSTLKIPISYTINNQFKARLSHELYLNQNRYILDGHVEFSSVPLFFYGIGPNTEQDAEEIYTSRLIQVEQDFFRKVSKNFFVGGRFVFNNQKITETIGEESLLEVDGLIPGNRGGTVSGLGLLLRWDRRDHVINSGQGTYLQADLTTYPSWLGSDFVFTKLNLDFRAFKPLLNHRHLLALQVLIEKNWGDPPFDFLALLGGDVIMRGHYQGRFRDKTLVAMQLEYRLPLFRKEWIPEPGKLKFWQRWGMVFFAGTGTVGEELSDSFPRNLKMSLGLGLRFLAFNKERLNIRIDFGFGSQLPGYYLNVKEAF